MTKSLFELLNLRSDWEEIVKDYKIEDHNGTIDNLRWFVENGVTNNRFRPKFKTAVKLANEIISEAQHYEKANISGIPRT